MISPERLFVVITISVLLTLAIVFVRTLNARRQAALTEPAWHVLGEQPDGRRTLIAFSTPSCAACHKAQAPAIEVVQERLGADQLRVIKVDAARQPEIAKAFGILTVPSTVVIGGEGTSIVAVNQGFAPSSRLVEQLRQA